ncbi:Carboxypeptidase B [Armadillidium vulgare]|nr:Carboxypeptidase B [Armadillidium vulgare]
MLNQILTNSSYESVLEKMDFYFLPVMNPDGYDYTFTDGGRLWRKTRSKTDSAVEDSNPCSDNYSGEEPFSEKEVRNAKEKMIASIWNLKAYLSYHSYAQLFLFPWGYTDDVINDIADLDAVASAAVDAIYTYSGTRYKQQQYCLESDLCVYGNSIDYFKGLTTIKYCYLVQLPDLGNYGYLLPPTEIHSSRRRIFERSDCIN